MTMPRTKLLHIELCFDVHGCQLSHKVAEDVGHGDNLDGVHLAADGAGVSPAAGDGGVGQFLQHGGCHAAAAGAHVGHGAVGAVEQAVLQQEGRAVGQQRIPLHLPKADPAFHVPPLDGLVGDGVSGPRGPHLELVGDHVTQALVVHHPHEDVCLQLHPADAAVHLLRPKVVVTCAR